jgi:hypothetical protein
MPKMVNNLIPPFIMRAGGAIVNDTAKIHCIDPTIDDHCIFFRTSDLRIPLQLIGTFSFFHSRMPGIQELYDCDKVFITPDSSDWNPHCTSFELNERAMTNYEGEIEPKSRRLNLLMETEDEANETYELATVTAAEFESHIDNQISITEDTFTFKHDSPQAHNHSDGDFADALLLRAEISKFGASIGSCTLSSKDSCSIFTTPATASFNDLETLIKDMVEPSQLGEIKSVIAAISAGTPKGPSAKYLSKLWLVSEKLAEGSLNATTQLKRHNSDNILSRQFSTNDRMLRYRRLNSVFFSDTMFATPKAKSRRGFTCCQVFVSDKGFVAVYPMKNQQDFKTALHWFCKQVGVPVSLVVDAHSAQTGNDTKRFCDQVGTILRILEKGTPWSNRAELYIGLLKEAVRKDMRASNSPMCLWDYAIERRALIHNVIPRPLFQNNGLTPHEATFGSQGDISKICNFGWYEWIYYRDHGAFPNAKEKLGRALGPLRNEGNEMAQAILTSKGTIIPRRTIRKLKQDELISEIEKRKRQLFDDLIRSTLGDSMNMPPKPLDPIYTPYSDGVEPDPVLLPDDNDPVDSNNNAMFEKPITDRWIHAELNLPQGEELKRAKVIGRSKNDDGTISGTYDDLPHKNSVTYDVEFNDGEVREYSANVIAENMYSQVDANGYSHTLLESIIDYTKDESAVDRDDMYIQTKSGQRRIRQTTIGWKLLVLWKDGSEEWIPLKILKESHPVEVAEFATARNISNEPAFCWWVPFTLRKRDRIISAVKSRVTRITHKYGVEIPRSINEAFKIDERNGDTF